jgi:FkbM family methyltransferase
MKTFYAIIDNIADFSRKNLRYESLLWKILRFFQNILHFEDYSPFKRKKFQKNDIFFESILNKLGKNKLEEFFVLQIGACDGVMADPIYHIINKYGWSGLLVEPQKSEFENLKLNYIKNKNIKLENVAISDSIRDRKLYKLEDKEIKDDWQRGTASFLDKPRFGSFEIVKCVTFENLLKRNNVNEIDLLQIDVEGYDFELLKMFDFSKYMPSLIRYEHKHLNFSDKLSCKKLLESNGYKLFEMEKDTGAILYQHLYIDKKS